MGEWKKTGCNFCGLACNLEAYVEDGHIKSIKPDADGIRNPGAYCCRKGRSSGAFQENPERIDYPMKKVGNHFERIGWEQAFTEIAEKANKIIAEHGPRSFAYCGGALANDQSDVAIGKAMAAAIGSQYVFNPVGIEFGSNWWAHGRILGHQGYYTEADDKNVEMMIFWGSNAYVSHQIQHTRPYIRENSERPDRYIVTVDPRLSETARMSDIHIMPQAGTDALMLRGLISYIVQSRTENTEWLNKWCSDWDKAKPYYETFDYEEAFRVAGVPLEQMKEFCRLLTTKVWGLHQDLGVFCGRHSTLTSYLLLTLMAVTGNLQTQGNVSLDSFATKGPLGDERDPGIWRTTETGRFPVTGVFPCGIMSDEILSEHPDHIRVMFMSMANPAMSWPDSKRTRKALDSLELFVAIDIVETESTKYADYVLPGKTGFEAYQWSTFQATAPEVLAFEKKPIIGQIGERKDNGQIWFEIMRRMGFIPEMDAEIYEAAVRSVEKKDLCVFMPKFLGYMKKNLEYRPYATFMMVDALSKPEAMGSVSRAFLRAAMATSPLSGSGIPERAGFRSKGKYRPLKLLKKTKALYDLSTMDNVFWAVDEAESGIVIGYSNPDRDAFAREHIFYEDHKVRLFDECAMHFMDEIMPEKESMLLEKTKKEYPLILSSGNHEDGGDNTSMRNPATYRYRKPYTLLLNPADAEKMNVSDEEIIRLVTKGGEVTAPVEYSWKTPQGYCVIPHHYGLDIKGEKKYGCNANDLTFHLDMDEIAGNPTIRYVPCRVEKLSRGE